MAIQMTREEYQKKYGVKPDIPSVSTPTQTTPLPKEKSVGGFLGNVVKSGASLVGGIASSIAHPIETTKAIGGIALGGAEKLIPGKQKSETNFDNLVSFFKNRYGTPKALVETLYTDPVGVAADISTIAGGAGLVAKASRLTKASDVLKTISKTTEPISQTFKAVGSGIEKATKGKTIAPFAKSFQPEVADIALERGVKLPASSLSKSGVVRTLETISGKGFFGQGVIDTVEKAGLKLNDVANKTISSIRSTTDLSSAGRVVQKGFNDFRENFFKTKSELYSKAQLGGKKIEVSTPKTISILDRIIKQKSEAAKVLGSDPVDLKFFDNLRDGLSGGVKTKFGTLKTGEKNYANEVKSALSELNKKIKNFNDPISTGNQAVLKNLFTTLSEELDETIKLKNPELAEAIDTANKYFKDGLSKLESSYGNKITEFSNQPDKIVPAIVNGTASVEDIPRIFEVVGEEATNAIRSTFLDKLFSDARGANGVFKPNGLNQQLVKYGLPKLEAVLTPEQVKAVLDLDKLSKALGRGQYVAEGSQTAFIGRMMAETLGVFSNPLFALKAVIGDLAFSKFISSPTGQKFLTEGVTLSGKTGRGVKRIGEIGRITPISRLVNYQDEQTPTQ